MSELAQTTALDLAIGAAMMAVPVALGIAARLFFDCLLHVRHNRAK